nr:hypothetical protein [Marinifilum fragile]
MSSILEMLDMFIQKARLIQLPLRKSIGLSPNCFLKAVEKCEAFSYPHFRSTSAMFGSYLAKTMGEEHTRKEASLAYKL